MGPARSPHLTATAPSLLTPRVTVPVLSLPAPLHQNPISHHGHCAHRHRPSPPPAPPTAGAAGQRAQTGPTADTPGMLGAGWPLARATGFSLQQHAVTVTNSRRTGTSTYDTSRVKQTPGRRRRSETPANLRGGMGGHQPPGTAPTARLRAPHHLPAINGGAGGVMLLLPTAS